MAKSSNKDQSPKREVRNRKLPSTADPSKTQSDHQEEVRTEHSKEPDDSDRIIPENSIVRRVFSVRKIVLLGFVCISIVWTLWLIGSGGYFMWDVIQKQDPPLQYDDYKDLIACWGWFFLTIVVGVSGLIYIMAGARD